MNKRIFFMFLLMIVSLGLVNASTSCDLDITLVNQDPYPAVPNSYVEVVFQMSGIQDSSCDGAWFELVTGYPFSLDENDNLRVIEENTWVFDYSTVWMIPYKLRVGKDALDGASEIEVRYGSGIRNSDSYFSEKFNITVEDSRTSFDAVIQETVMGETSIAIANIGQNDANAAIVRIPKQEGVVVKSNNGQMIGDLEQGDYTVVAFSFEGTGEIDLQIDYTDDRGVRRSEVVVIHRGSDSSNSASTISGSRKNGSAVPVESDSNTMTWLILAATLVVIVFFSCKYYKNKKLLKIKGVSSSVPDWMKNKKGTK